MVRSKTLCTAYLSSYATLYMSSWYMSTYLCRKLQYLSKIFVKFSMAFFSSCRDRLNDFISDSCSSQGVERLHGSIFTRFRFDRCFRVGTTYWQRAQVPPPLPPGGASRRQMLLKKNYKLTFNTQLYITTTYIITIYVYFYTYRRDHATS